MMTVKINHTKELAAPFSGRESLTTVMVTQKKSLVSTRSKFQATGSISSKAFLVALLFGVCHGMKQPARDLSGRDDGQLVGGVLGWAHKSNVKKDTKIPKWTRRYWRVEPQTEDNGLVTMSYFSDDRCEDLKGSFEFVGKSLVLGRDSSQAKLWPGFLRICKGHEAPEGRGLQITGTLSDKTERIFHLSFENERTFRDFFDKMQQYGICQKYAPSRGGIGIKMPFAQAAAAAANAGRKLGRISLWSMLASCVSS